MASRINVNRLASQIRRPNAPAMLPAADGMHLHLAVINSHNPSRNESNATFNTPGTPTLGGIPVLQMYNTAAGINPQPGDVVQVIQIGNTVAVLGMQLRPSGIVTFG